jgi:integrase
MKLTVKTTTALELPAGKSDHVYFDDDIGGFGLRLREGGSRAWIYRYRIGRKQRSITLGNAKAVPLALARENAGRLEAKVRLGADPALDKQANKLAADNLTHALIDEYLDARMAKWRPSSLRHVRRYLLEYAKPLHKLPITSISQRNVDKLLGDIAKASGDVSSNRLRAALAAFLTWVIKKGIRLPDGNVASYTERRNEQSRERVLSNVELRNIWHALHDDDYSAIIKLLLLTGQRAAEIGSLRWDEVTDDEISLPGTRTKNKRPHKIPLSTPAKAIIDKHRILGRTFVFGRDDSAGFQGWGVCKERLNARLTKINEPWVVHDLRRTAVTGMCELGVLPHIVEAVINHISGHKGGVAGIYNRAAYDTEKRDALDRWAKHVLAIVGA